MKDPDDTPDTPEEESKQHWIATAEQAERILGFQHRVNTTCFKVILKMLEVGAPIGMHSFPQPNNRRVTVLIAVGDEAHAVLTKFYEDNTPKKGST